MSEQAAKRVPIIAMGFAVAALVTVLIAVVVVINRGDPKPVVGPPPPAERRVDATDVVRLDSDDALVPAAGGVRIRDPELAKKLGLTVDDLIVSISGRAVSRQFDVHEVIFNTSMMKVTTLYVEVGSDHRIVRWQLDGDLRNARYAVRPPPSAASASLFGGYPSTGASPDPLLDTIEKIDDTHFTVPKATVDALLVAPARLVASARLVPAMKNGVPDGLKLYAIRPSSVFAHVGLQNGDTIETLNGERVDDPAKMAATFTKLKGARELTLALVRRGRPVTLTISEK